MSFTGNLLLINNATPSRRRFRQSTELYVPYLQGEPGYDNKATSISSTQLQENKRFLLNLKRWSTAKKASSTTVTAKGIARLVEKIAQDGRVTVEDEDLVLRTISVQRGWWATLVVMDTLICALTTAMLNFESLPDNGHWSKEGGDRLLFAYHTTLSLLLYFTNVHLVMLLLLSGLTTFVFEVKGILTFFVRCHSLLVHVNFSGMIFILPGFCLVPVLAQVYSYGIAHAVPAMILSLATFIWIAVLYIRVIRPLFAGIYDEEYDIGSYSTSTSEQTEPEKISGKETA